jgi:hypothetical protein
MGTVTNINDVLDGHVALEVECVNLPNHEDQLHR